MRIALIDVATGDVISSLQAPRQFFNGAGFDVWRHEVMDVLIKAAIKNATDRGGSGSLAITVDVVMVTA